MPKRCSRHRGTHHTHMISSAYEFSLKLDRIRNFGLLLLSLPLKSRISLWMHACSFNPEPMSHKRKRNDQKKKKATTATPLLPPDVADDEVDIIDEDLHFVAEHRQYAGFFSNLDTSTITRQVLGLKSSKKEEDNLEAYYEKRAKLVSKVKDEDMQGNLFDPVDVLPVKTITGELHYCKARSNSQLEVEDKEEGLNIEGREVLARMKKRTKTSQPSLVIADVPSQANRVALNVEGKKKLSKPELRKERKKAKKESQSLSNGRSTLKNTSSHFLALEELQQDLSEEERVEEMKAQMAELGTAVLANPENNLESLTELQVLCTDKNANIARMAMLSLLAVYRDIIPGYRIRLPTQKELGMQVSKEVKELRDFETKLLKCYQKYVQILINSAKSVLLRRPASRCVCGLLEAIPHFNFRDSLLSVTIPLMDSANPECRAMSCSAVKSLFQNEGKHGGSATVEAVELIADLVKTEKCIVRPDVIQVLLSLSFDENLNSRPASEKEKANGRDSRVEKFNSKHQEEDKKAKKRQLAAKFREEVIADFRESCALPEAGEIRRLQSQTLSAVFETFFRVLKTSFNPQDSAHDTNSALTRSKLKEYGSRPLLRPCLHGLAKFSHLINVDFMGDLLAILKRLAAGIPEPPGGEAQNVTPLSFTDRIHCCVVAFKIVRSNLDALNIDLREFYVSLYNLLLCHNFIRDEHEDLVLAEALQIMLWESRQHDMQRVAAFIKRLAVESLHLGSAEAISALVTVRHLLQRYKKCCNLLENDDGGVVGNLAVLQREGADPDLSGALSSVLWEVSLLSRHYHPDVAKIATQISNMVNSSEVLQAVLTPKEAIAVYSTTKGGFNPSIQMPKKVANKKSYLSHYRVQPEAVVLKDGSLDPGTNCSKETDEIFVPHFKVLQNIKENEALRSQLNKTIRSIESWKIFKAKRKQTPLSIQKFRKLKS